jgi:hypothetical protein
MAPLWRRADAAASLTSRLLKWAHPCAATKEERTDMTGLALVMFITLIAFGQRYFGWSDPDGKIQLMLFTTFILGVICGYKTKG